MKKITGLLIAVFFTTFLFGQKSWGLGIEVQAYPTGILPGLRIEKNFSERHAAHLRLGANIFDHRHLGKHYIEKGIGYGFTLGYKRYFQPSHQGLFLGIRNDVWFNNVEWRKNTKMPPLAGTTKITVIQPTIEGGYTFVKNNLFFAHPC